MPTDSFGTGNPLLCANPNALTEPEKLLAAYFRSSTVGLCILDTQFRYLAVNSTLAEMNGVPASAHLGKTVREVLGDFADVVEPGFRKVFSNGDSVLNFEVSALLHTRTEMGHWMEYYLPIKNANGIVTRIAIIVVETTAQKKLEASVLHLDGKLRKEMDRLQMLMDVSTIIASSSNLTQVFPQISARIRRLFHHEYAGVELHDAKTGLLIRQAEDFPLGKGMLSAVRISPGDSPGGQSLRKGAPLIFAQEQMQEFEAEIARNFLRKDCNPSAASPCSGPRGRWEFWFWAVRERMHF